MKTSARFLIAALLLTQSLATHAASGGTSWRDELPNAVLIGTGEMTWFGLKIYRASLWGEQRPFDPNKSFALELTYQRNITKDQFINTSIKEIHRIFGERYSEAKLNQWAAKLGTAFVDVQSGDQLIGLYRAARGCSFYGKQGLLVHIDDLELAQAFFAIWLDTRTRERDLREHLLGNVQ